MILELDAGNSRIKWRLLDASTTRITGEGAAPDPEALAIVLGELAPPRMVRMSSVRSEDVNIAIARFVEARWQLPVHQARVQASCAGVRNQYKDQGRLGVDRWLAMLAGFRRAQGACIVIDSGTAMTIDCVAADGLHEGGYITPGLRLMRDSLVNNTRIRLAPDPGAPSLDLGHSTDAAVNNGTLALLLALIDRVVAASRRDNPATAVFLSGGDAELLARLAAITDGEVVPSLVLDGLALACPDPGGH